MGRTRVWCKYLVKKGNRILDGGITTDLKRREQERKREYPRSHLFKVGRCTTEEAARKWEKEQGFS